MSEKLIRFFLSELETVRLVCAKANCGGVIEIPMKQLIVAGAEYRCPACQTSFNMPTKPTTLSEPLNMLGIGANGLEAQSSRFQVQFVLKDKGS